MNIFKTRDEYLILYTEQLYRAHVFLFFFAVYVSFFEKLQYMSLIFRLILCNTFFKNMLNEILFLKNRKYQTKWVVSIQGVVEAF